MVLFGLKCRMSKHHYTAPLPVVGRDCFGYQAMQWTEPHVGLWGWVCWCGEGPTWRWRKLEPGLEFGNHATSHPRILALPETS